MRHLLSHRYAVSDMVADIAGSHGGICRNCGNIGPVPDLCADVVENASSACPGKIDRVATRAMDAHILLSVAAGIPLASMERRLRHRQLFEYVRNGVVTSNKVLAIPRPQQNLARHFDCSARYPSNFESYSHSLPSSSREADRQGIGSRKRALDCALLSVLI